MSEQRIGRTAAIAWLEEAARYFLNKPDNGEDSAFWANRMNAENALKIAATLRGDQPWLIYCAACASAGIANCAHFDKCGQPDK